MDKWPLQSALYKYSSVLHKIKQFERFEEEIILSTSVCKINKTILILFYQLKLLTRSSSPAGQSGSPSQRHLFVIQVPSAHLKSSSLHFTFGQFNSSLLSPQSLPKRIANKTRETNKRRDELVIEDFK